MKNNLLRKRCKWEVIFLKMSISHVLQSQLLPFFLWFQYLFLFTSTITFSLLPFVFSCEFSYDFCINIQREVSFLFFCHCPLLTCGNCSSEHLKSKLKVFRYWCQFFMIRSDSRTIAKAIKYLDEGITYNATLCRIKINRNERKLFSSSNDWKSLYALQYSWTKKMKDLSNSKIFQREMKRQ